MVQAVTSRILCVITGVSLASPQSGGSNHQANIDYVHAVWLECRT
jgi:hypothetical protein